MQAATAQKEILPLGFVAEFRGQRGNQVLLAVRLPDSLADQVPGDGSQMQRQLRFHPPQEFRVIGARRPRRWLGRVARVSLGR